MQAVGDSHSLLIYRFQCSVMFANIYNYIDLVVSLQQYLKKLYAIIINSSLICTDAVKRQNLFLSDSPLQDMLKTV